MSELKITPGEWKVIEHNWSDTSIVSHANVVCTLSIEDEATEDTQDELEAVMGANAHLIAAAPELYEAVENLLHAHINDLGSQYHNEIMQALKALKKARGE